ncbi:MAG: L-histidine N(alpha)-methyltransferase, partial [Geminicoccaceae bacterium]|nr:L-histidine N(alpha)-methyltransferase [Geminicoccaceae bacterium]
MTSTAGRQAADHRQGLLRDVARGLSRPQKELPPKYFYDRRGSELFDEITRLPEYYLTRTERALLDCWSSALMTALRPRALVELGAGSADKTRLLLDAMRYSASGELYVPIDVSAEFLDDAAAR